MRIRDILLALTTMLLWGLNFAVAKLALTEFPPILLSALRFTLVALILLPFIPRPKRIRPIIELALTLGLLQFPMVFFGLTRLDASTASIVLQLQVPLGVVMAAVLLGEKLTWRHGIGMAVAFAGVALIAGAPRLEANRIGLIFLLIGSPVGPIAAATWRGWSGLFYTSLISTIVAFGLWAKLVARYSVSQTLPFMLTVPLFAIVGGIVLNGDKMTADIIAGGFLTLAGVGLIVLRWPRGRRLRMAVVEPS